MGLIKMASFLRLARFSNTLIGNLAILIDGSNPSSPNLKKTIVEIIHKANVIHHDGVLDIDYYPKKIILANISRIHYYNEYIMLVDTEKHIRYAYYLNELTVMCRIKLFWKWMWL
jgi:hypothetical protein